MSKTQDYLVGRRIRDVVHEPKRLIIDLDDGRRFTVGILEVSRDWETTDTSLDFEFGTTPRLEGE